MDKPVASPLLPPLLPPEEGDRGRDGQDSSSRGSRASATGATAHCFSDTGNGKVAPTDDGPEAYKTGVSTNALLSAEEGLVGAEGTNYVAAHSAK